MAYIQPNTRMILLSGVPLDETYEHTLYFADATSQLNYFYGQKKYEYAPQTYQRRGLGVVKVNQKADDLYDCNYLMFQNTSFGNKWFYAFILDVEYVNNTTSNVYYQIDYMQTWMFELTIHECWVEREHIEHDFVGASLTAENVGFGDLLTKDYMNIYGEDTYICIATTNKHLIYDWGNQFEQVITPNMIKDGRPSLACTLLLTVQDATLSITSGDDTAYNGMFVTEGVYAYLADHDQIDSIISVFELPTILVDNIVQGGTGESTGGLASWDVVTSTVKNKKLLQYPFNILELVDNNGANRVYRPEYFDSITLGGIPTFKFGVVFSTIPETYAIPVDYLCHDSVAEDITKVEFDNAFIGNAMPQVPYSVDSYRIWLAQNSTWFGGHRQEGSEIFSPIDAGRAVLNLAGATFAGALGGATKFAPTIQTSQPVNITQNGITTTTTMQGTPTKSPLLGGAIGAGVGAIGSLANTGLQVAEKVSNREKAKLLPDKYNAGTGGVASQKRCLGVTLYHKCLNAKDLQRIDDYFEMFGYNCNELKIPNTHSRPHWNYVKTTMANITGNIPSSDLSAIKAIFNNGITFWKHANEVGDYSLNNH